MTKRYIAAIITAIAASVTLLCAQTAAEAPIISTDAPEETEAAADPAAAEAPEVWLVTCYPGMDVYELEGHTALRLKFNDGRDVAVNWGVFDFNSPNFLYRFVKGETDYVMGIAPYELFKASYARHNRRVEEQKINLTPSEAIRLTELIDSTLTGNNRVYRYNYVKDNCATRPLRYLENAMGQKISLGANTLPGDCNSFRDDMTYYHRNYPWYQFGIDLALGSGIDYKLTNREHSFAPIMLREMMGDATGEDGRKAVTETNVTVEGNQELATGGPTPLPLQPIAVMTAVMLVTAIISARDVKRGKMTKWWTSLLYGVFGLAGLLLTFLIFVSEHEATSPNWQYLMLNPFCFIAAIGIWLKKCNKVVYFYQIINFVALLALAAAGLSGIQRLNVALYPLIVSDMLCAITYLYINKRECLKKQK